jgi:glycosyltransferase involved in cell wall biosynthesis
MELMRSLGISRRIMELSFDRRFFLTSWLMSSPQSTLPIVLTLIGAYWPGNNASGPNQSFRALAEALRDEFEFRLIARDRPFAATEPAAEIGRWVGLGFAKARYCRIGRLGGVSLGNILRETTHHILWLNGFFDREFTIPALVLRRMGRIPFRPTILSPRGEFGSGALGLKSTQKLAYLCLARQAGLLRGVTLHATSEIERVNIKRGVPWVHDVAIGPNVRLLIDPPKLTRPCDDVFRLVFVGRIARVKNLSYALQVLGGVKASVVFEVYGPVQDSEYWRECQQLIIGLPENVSVAYKGEIANENVVVALALADLLFLPTKGENFGHAIFEALSCGVPVLISDATPWRDLEQQAAGWDLPLTEPRRFAAAIDALAGMGHVERERLRRGARAHAEQWVEKGHAILNTKRILTSMLAAHARVPSFPTAEVLS